MLDFLTWCVSALGDYIRFLASSVLFGEVSILGLCAAILIIGMLIRSLLLVSR